MGLILPNDCHAESQQSCNHSMSWIYLRLATGMVCCHADHVGRMVPAVA